MKISKTSGKNRNIKKEKNELSILPDSCWLMALLDAKEPHHKVVKASFGVIFPFEPVFYISNIVYMETIANFIRKGMPVRKAFNKMSGLFKMLGNVRYNKELSIKSIMRKYKEFSRIKKIKKLKGADFNIVADGIFLGANILTCDRQAYDCVKKTYKNIFFFGCRSSAECGDLARLAELVF